MTTINKEEFSFNPTPPLLPQSPKEQLKKGNIEKKES
jgi:hypothetical protein